MREAESAAAAEARPGLGARIRAAMGRIGFGPRFFHVIGRVATDTFNEGFTYAGNFAYLSLVTLFPFLIVAAAIAQLVGRSAEGIRTLEAFLQTMPPDVGEVLRKPAADVLQARTGNLLWFGAIVGLWTTAGFIETLRGILRQSYGVTSSTPFWRYRLGAIGISVASVILAMAAFSFQVLLTGVEQFIYRLLPWASQAQAIVAATKALPALVLFGALYMLFYSLTPSRYRYSNCPKWPGPAFITLWWLFVTSMLPRVLSLLGSYDLTYGSLAGVMIVLIFFYLIGLGMVAGAELNAALAEPVPDRVEGARDKEDGAQ
nr:YihY/virulence factor BrkB family protein [uncultured Sphingomonas sp.]